MSSQNLIRDKAERYQRNADNMQLVMQFLIQETYSTISNLMMLLNYQKRQPLDRLLAKLKCMGLVKKHELKTPEGKLALWGVTDLGIGQYLQIGDEDAQSFQPYRVKYSVVNHKMLLQQVRLNLEKNGWSNWQNGKSESFREKYKIEHKPDAVMSIPSGEKIALEIALSLRAATRYRAIFKSHIEAKENKYWSAVFFIVQDEMVRKLLENRFDKIEYIRFNESKHPFDHYRSKLVRIFTFDEIATLQYNAK